MDRENAKMTDEGMKMPTAYDFAIENVKNEFKQLNLTEMMLFKTEIENIIDERISKIMKRYEAEEYYVREQEEIEEEK